MADAEKKQNFWTTLPGILTGIATLLTAATGLLVVMYPHGFAGPKESPAAVVGAETAAAARGGSVAASAKPKGQKPTALIVGKDGTETRVFLDSLKDSYTDNAISLASGQSIPFDKIASIDFLEVHDRQRDIKVTLTDGRAVEGSMQAWEQFRGESDIGPFAISVVNLKRVAFER